MNSPTPTHISDSGLPYFGGHKGTPKDTRVPRVPLKKLYLKGHNMAILTRLSHGGPEGSIQTYSIC